mmetsp:Transcript_24546/g.36370  ORF Transcript_24546/g.36370 Transcript_24546/m.36370 type:complete len:225 (+) Transcript_24546:755-1429(+)
MCCSHLYRNRTLESCWIKVLELHPSWSLGIFFLNLLRLYLKISVERSPYVLFPSRRSSSTKETTEVVHKLRHGDSRRSSDDGPKDERLKINFGSRTLSKPEARSRGKKGIVNYMSDHFMVSCNSKYDGRNEINHSLGTVVGQFILLSNGGYFASLIESLGMSITCCITCVVQPISYKGANNLIVLASLGNIRELSFIAEFLKSRVVLAISKWLKDITARVGRVK